MSVDKELNSQVLLTLSKELLKEIENYQFENRIKNRSQAIRELIEKGLGG
ncbi:ribbon-helix-helix domain-containing protein [Staphylococcus saprophyticus]|nr:ribbon-helix-helix domain-containing protein [Staphylococcus saprophyticus]MDW4228982.1 ribbon-helix-helix domain-containing protein [Staphylococcus saprophyticus]MDW4351482.1 ribbon-helix-helix domain-containing protein [Staphylococcus saprophyticus]